MEILERFLNYVKIYTTSDEESGLHPSASREFELAKVLEEELKELGLSSVTLTDTCYVYGLLPATKGMEDKKSVALIAHMDTAPDYNGENVNPQIIKNYDGNDVTLPATGAVLTAKDFPRETPRE